MVFESAAGAPKNQVFLDQVSCRTPPRGGGVSADLNHLSKITGFLNHLTPMTEAYVYKINIFAHIKDPLMKSYVGTR